MLKIENYNKKRENNSKDNKHIKNKIDENITEKNKFNENKADKNKIDENKAKENKADDKTTKNKDENKTEKIETCYFCRQKFDMNKDDLSHYKYGKFPMCDYCSQFYGFYSD